MLTDRELASLIWIGVLILLALILPKWRRIVVPGARDVARAFFVKAIIRVLALYTLWCAAWVALAYWIGFWNLDLLKDTLIVMFGVGYPLLFKVTNAKSGIEIWHSVRREAIGLSVFFAFYLNLESLPLWGELISQPILTFVVIMFTFSQTRKEWRAVTGCAAVLLLLEVLALVVWTTVQTVSHWADLDGRMILLQLALSIWLPLITFPALYVVAFYSSAQTLMHRLNWLNKGMPWRAQFGVFIGLHFSVRWVKAMNGRYNGVAKSKTFREALKGMQDFRDDVVRREALDAQEQQDLIDFAGVTGADGTGAQQDRREFYGTKEALRFLHIAQIGRYEGRGGTFWDDLADVVISGHSQYGLPTPHDIRVETTPDQKRYRAWRRTPSGWVLGVGGTGRSGEWFYAQDHEPTTWPGDADSEWVDGAREQWPPDWDRYDGSHI